jgi:hypothetical protein
MDAESIRLVDYAPYIQAAADRAGESAASRRASAARCKRKADAAAEEARIDDRVPGDAHVAAIRRMLDNFPGYSRSLAQQRFHKCFLGATLAHIYGPADFEKYRERILGDHDLTEVTYEVLVCTPRRFGKTTAVSMFCAALLMCVPDMWIACFSTGQRASSSLLDLTAKLLCTQTGGAERILKKNQEQLFLKGDSPADVRRLFSYPSSVAGLKGVGGKVIILEEASRLDEAVFTEVIVPLFGVKDTVREKGSLG